MQSVSTTGHLQYVNLVQFQLLSTQWSSSAICVCHALTGTRKLGLLPVQLITSSSHTSKSVGAPADADWAAASSFRGRSSWASPAHFRVGLVAPLWYIQADLPASACRETDHLHAGPCHVSNFLMKIYRLRTRFQHLVYALCICGS